MSAVLIGGPAFPQPLDATTSAPREGMSLRDYFAAAIVGALDSFDIDRLAAPDQPTQAEVDDNYKYVVPPAVLAVRRATAAYLIADAMLKARETSL